MKNADRDRALDGTLTVVDRLGVVAARLEQPFVLIAFT